MKKNVVTGAGDRCGMFFGRDQYIRIKQRRIVATSKVATVSATLMISEGQNRTIEIHCAPIS